MVAENGNRPGEKRSGQSALVVGGGEFSRKIKIESDWCLRKAAKSGHYQIVGESCKILLLEVDEKGVKNRLVLKPGSVDWQAFATFLKTAFNRTIVELKSQLLKELSPLGKTFNRTIVELKYLSGEL